MVLDFIHSVALVHLEKCRSQKMSILHAKFLSLIFTTVATFSESLETYIYCFESILLTVFAIHGIYFVGNLAIP